MACGTRCSLAETNRVSIVRPDAHSAAAWHYGQPRSLAHDVIARQQLVEGRSAHTELDSRARNIAFILR